MRFFITRLLAASASVGKFILAVSDTSDIVVPPSQDPFYSIPDGIESSAPGAILRHRTPPSPLVAFSEPAKHLKEIYHIFYRTSDVHGNATATAATILIPQNPDFGKVVSFSVAEDACCMDCAPSFGFQVAAQNYPKLRAGTMAAQLVLSEAALYRGWTVVVVDSGGPSGASPGGKLSAYATLDGIRAALQSTGVTGIQTNASVSMFGYSGGAGVIYDAVRLQPSYAPELKIAGAAIGGARTRGGIDPVLGLSLVNKGPAAGLIPIFLQTFASQSQEFDAMIRQHLKPQYHERFYNASTQCLQANYGAFRNQDIFSMFDSTRFISHTTEYAQGLMVPDVTPQIPLYWLQLKKDELIPVSDTSKTVSELCSRGSRIEYEIEMNWKYRHASYALIATSHAFRWLDKAMSASGADVKCSKKKLFTKALDSDVLDAYSDKTKKYFNNIIDGQPF